MGRHLFHVTAHLVWAAQVIATRGAKKTVRRYLQA